MDHVSFSKIAIISCGTLSLELNHLQEEGFLDTNHLFYTTPGLHEDPRELERQLIKRINKAKETADKVLVVYGGKYCYMNSVNPTRTMKNIIEEQNPNVVKIDATHCMDMIASEAEREKIAQEVAGGEKVWWMAPSRIKFRHRIFKGWDSGLANENFLKPTGLAVVLDGIGYVKKYKKDYPKEILEYSKWIGIPILEYAVTLDRFKSLLSDQARVLSKT